MDKRNWLFKHTQKPNILFFRWMKTTIQLFIAYNILVCAKIRVETCLIYGFHGYADI